MTHPDAERRAALRPPNESLPNESAAAGLRRLIMGFRTTQLVYVLAKLGLADRLAQAPQTPEALARAVGAEPQALYRVLRALAGLGLLAETDDGTFTLTPLARPLLADTPDSLRGLAILYGEEWLWDAYGRTLHSVRSGEPAFAHANGEPLFEYLQHRPDAAAVFNEAMSGYSTQEAAAVVAAYDFADVATVVDVGGGYGTLVAALLRAHPRLSAVVYDRESVVAGARRQLAAAGLATRTTCIGGDFFSGVPGGGSVYLLKSVLHDWDDAACVTILRHCREVMAGDARLLVVERVVPPGNTPSEAKLFDINMLVVTGGRERTEREYQALLQAAGFRLTRVVPTDSPLSLIEGVRAETG